MVHRYLGYLLLVLMRQCLINIVFEATPVTSQQCVPGYNSGIGCTLWCHVVIGGCLSCTSSSVCTSCFSGYLQSSPIQCDLCYILMTGCSTCSSSTSCTTCNAFYAKNSTGDCTLCSSFITYCQKCSSNTTCTLCTSGYAVSAGICKTCSEVITYCTTCKSSGVCLSCLSTYGLLKESIVLYNGLCKTCGQLFLNCETCFNNITCSTCLRGYTIKAGICTNCSLLIQNCKFCFNTTSCQQCYDPYEADSNNKCICKLTLFNVSGLCIDDRNCIFAYQNNNKVLCSFCNTQNLYVLNQMGKCVCKVEYQQVNSTCQQKCGDGIIIKSPCDDNNTIDGDGCSSTCQIENDFVCTVLPTGISQCKFNKDVKLKFDSVQKILPENKGLIYISLDSHDANLKFFYESQKFNFSVTSNRSGTITILNWARNSEGQIVIQIEYNETIQESMIELTFTFSNDTILSNNNFLKFQLKGSNFPLAMSVCAEKYQQINKIQFYFFIISYAFMLTALLSDKFIGVEAANTLQLVFFSLLLIYNNDSWPQSFSTLQTLKFSTGLNQLFYQQKTYQNINDLTFIKYGYLSKFFPILGICESFFLNNFTNCAILFVAFTIFIILFIIKTNKQKIIFQLNYCPQKKILRKELEKFRRFFRRIYNFTFHFSYIMILQMFVSLYVETSYLKQLSPFIMAVNKLTAIGTFTILIVTILENYNHFFLSNHDTIVEKYQVGLREMSYKRIYFLYLFLNVFCIILLNNKLFFGYSISCLLLVASLVYLVYLLVYRPYKHSFLIHGVTIVLNHLMYILILAMITLLNFSFKINEFYHLIFSYTLMGFTFVVVFLAVIRVIIDFKYDANNVSEQIKLEIEANRKVQEQRIANQITKQTVQKQKPQKKKLSKNDNNTYLYPNQKLVAEKIDFLNEIKKKSFLTEWEKDQIYNRIYERKPINWAKENEKEKKYKLLLAKEKQIIERDQDRQEMLRLKNQKANDKAYIDQMQNLKEKLRGSLLARGEKQVQIKQAKKKKRNKEKE